jgi:hypothetical protein
MMMLGKDLLGMRESGRRSMRIKPVHMLSPS